MASAPPEYRGPYPVPGGGQSGHGPDAPGPAYAALPVGHGLPRRPQPGRLRGAPLWNVVASHLVWGTMLALGWGCAAFLAVSVGLSNPYQDYSGVMGYVRFSFWGPVAALAAGWLVAGPALAVRRERLAVWALSVLIYGWTLLWVAVTLGALLRA